MFKGKSMLLVGALVGKTLVRFAPDSVPMADKIEFASNLAAVAYVFLGGFKPMGIISRGALAFAAMNLPGMVDEALANARSLAK